MLFALSTCPSSALYAFQDLWVTKLVSFKVSRWLLQRVSWVMIKSTGLSVQPQKWLSIDWDQYTALMYNLREPYRIHVHLIMLFPSSSLDKHLLKLLVICLLTKSMHIPKWITAHCTLSFIFLYTLCNMHYRDLPKEKTEMNISHLIMQRDCTG